MLFCVVLRYATTSKRMPGVLSPVTVCKTRLFPPSRPAWPASYCISGLGVLHGHMSDRRAHLPDQVLELSLLSREYGGLEVHADLVMSCRLY